MTLLSGRSCSQIYDIEGEQVQDVLRQSAELLDMDSEIVERNGALMSGALVIKDLQEDRPVADLVMCSLFLPMSRQNLDRIFRISSPDAFLK